MPVAAGFGLQAATVRTVDDLNVLATWLAGRDGARPWCWTP